jgi:hypothetical protein
VRSARLLVVSSFLASFIGSGFAATFEVVHRVPVGNQPDGVAVGDFNHDGKLDMVVANLGDSSLSLVLGNGNGTFWTWLH